MGEGYQEPLPLDLPAAYSPAESYDLTGMSADEIVGLHRDIHQRNLVNGTGLDDDLGEAFDAGFEEICVTDPSTATDVLARFSLSFDTDEQATFICHLINLAKGNTAAAMSFFEDIFNNNSEENLASEGAEMLAKAREIGVLSLDQTAYLLRVNRTKPLRQSRWQ